MTLKYRNYKVDPVFSELLNDGWLRFAIDAPANVLFHFAEYEISSIWDFYNEEIPMFYSEIKGGIAPQDFRQDGHFTAAFKGPHETKLHLMITPS